MQQKNNLKLHKRITALLMSGVLLATSIPLMTQTKALEPVVDEYWSPEPYFSDAARDEGASAWFKNDGSIALKFPAAVGGETSMQDQATKKNIQSYIFEVTALGKKNPDLAGGPEVVSQTPLYTTVVDAKSLTKTKEAKSMLTMVFAPGVVKYTDMSSGKPVEKPVTRDTDLRLNIRITAVDEGNWFSEPMDTIVTDVPVFEYDENRFRPIDETNPNAMREIMQFEADALNSGANYTNFTGDGKHLEFVHGALKPNTGAVIGSTNYPSKGIGFRLYREIDKAAPSVHTFDTNTSREAWDFYGAEEVWFWFDCSEVCLNNVSLRLRSHEKLYTIWADGTFEKAADHQHSKVVYSTKGFAEHASPSVKEALAKPVAEGGKRILVQQKDGGWNEVNIAKGEQLNLDHFKGYIRVPIEFFCSEADSKATARIDNLGAWRNDSGKAKIIIPETVVNPAGTCINQATLMSTLQFKKGLWTSPTYNAPAPLIGNMTYSAQINKDRRLKYDPASKAFNEDNRFFDEENVGVDGKPEIFKKQGSFKAIEDIYSVGFSFDSTTNSEDHIFFFDSVMAYKPTGKYPANNLNGTVSSGEPVNSFYNQQQDRANIILDGIDKILPSPSWTDYKEVELISDMLEGFSKSFGEKPGDPNNIFVDTDENAKNGMTKMATELGRLDTWKKYREARALCLEYGTIKEVNGALEVSANADLSDLVPGMIDILEALPPHEWLVSPTAEEKQQIVKLYQAYVMLNRAQLEVLGDKEKQACFEYFSILGRNLGASQDDFVVGKHLAEKPFLPFCDFETADIGMNQIVPRVEDDHSSYYAAETDTRHTKGVNTVTGPPDSMNDKDQYLLEPAIPNETDIHATTAFMRQDGFMGSKAPRIYFNTNTDTVATLTVSRDGKNHANLSDLKKSGGCGANGYKLGDLARDYVGDEATEPPLSLIFYADFSEITEEFNLIVNIFTVDTDGSIIKVRPNLSWGPGSEQHRKFFLLDPVTGNWELTHCGGSQYHFNSTNLPGQDKLDLNGYKGYVRIPLYHLKAANGFASEGKLDKSSTWLNNIFAIQIGVGQQASRNDSLRGKSFVIDNIGFTYSKAIYVDDAKANPAAKNRPLDKTYEEVYNAKANPAVEFEYAVNELDFFREDQALQVQKTKDAIALYNALTKTQRELPSVQNAVASLKRAADWANLVWDGKPGSAVTPGTGTSPRPNAVDPFHPNVLADPNATAAVLDSEKMTYKRDPLTLENFRLHVEDPTVFPDKAKHPEKASNFPGITIPDGKTVLDVKTDKNVRFPGFITDPNNNLAVGKVNYEALGFTGGKEQVDKILLLFEYGFSRLSWADQMKFRKATKTNGMNDLTEADIWNMDPGKLNAMPDSPQFIEAWNVYKAAVRCRELEKTREAVLQMVDGNNPEEYNGILSMYKKFEYTPEGTTIPEPNPPKDEKNLFAEIARHDEMLSIYKSFYVHQPYYAKLTTKYGALIPALENLSESAKLFLINSKTYQFGATTMDSGLLQLQKDYNKLNDDLNMLVTADKLITPTLYVNVMTAMNNYDHLMLRFKNVGELYTPIEHIRRKFPIVKTLAAGKPQDKPTDLYMTAQNVYTDVNNLYDVTYAVDLSEMADVTKENWLTFTPTAGQFNADIVNLTPVPYALTFTMNKVKKDSTGKVLETTPIAEKSFDSTAMTASAGKPLELCKIDPNLYGEDANGNKYELQVSVKSTMNEADIQPGILSGEDSFLLNVMTKNTADGTLGAYEPARNQLYASDIQAKTCTVSYAIEDTYTVEFPAETQITWGDTTEKPVGFKVSTNMRADSAISVSVDDKKGAMTQYKFNDLTVGAHTYSLGYQQSGFNSVQTYTGTTATPQSYAAGITVTDADWKKAAIGNYETHLTYTVTYKEGSTPAPMPTPNP